MEPPSKRRRVQQNALEQSDDDDDELSYRPEEASAQKTPTARYEKRRERASNKLQSTFEDIFAKYGRDFDGVGDEVDMMTGRVIVDNGHLTKMQKKKDVLPDRYCDDTDESDMMLSEDGLTWDEDEEDDENDEDGEGEEQLRPGQKAKILRGPKAWLLPGEKLFSSVHPAPSAFQRTAARAASASISSEGTHIRRVRMRAPWTSTSDSNNQIPDAVVDEFSVETENQEPTKTKPFPRKSHVRPPKEGMKDRRSIEKSKVRPLEVTQGNQENPNRTQKEREATPRNEEQIEAAHSSDEDKEQWRPHLRGKSRFGRVLKDTTGAGMVSWTRVLDEGLLGKKKSRKLEKELSHKSQREAKSDPSSVPSTKEDQPRVEEIPAEEISRQLAPTLPPIESRNKNTHLKDGIPQLSDDESSFQAWETSAPAKIVSAERKKGHSGQSRQPIAIEVSGPSSSTPRSNIRKSRVSQVAKPTLDWNEIQAEHRSSQPPVSDSPKSTNVVTSEASASNTKKIESSAKAPTERIIPDSTQEEDPYDIPSDDSKKSPSISRPRSVIPNSTSTPPSSSLISKRLSPSKSPFLSPSKRQRPQTPRHRAKDTSRAPSSRRSLLSILSDEEDGEAEINTSARARESSFRKRLHDAYDATPSKNRVQQVVIITPGNTRRVCGADGFHCGRGFCFSCQRDESKETHSGGS